MMDLEGLKAWLPGRTPASGAVAMSVAAERFFDRRQPRPVTALPLFPVTTVGSWPRPPAAARRAAPAPARTHRPRGVRCASPTTRCATWCDCRRRPAATSSPTASCVATTSIRSSPRSSTAFALMTLAEMLDVVEDKVGFERLLQTLDVPAYSISNPICVGRIERREPLALDDLRFVRRHTQRPVKVTLPGPVPAHARDVRPRGDAGGLSDEGRSGRGRRRACCARRCSRWRRKAPTSSSSTSRC